MYFVYILKSQRYNRTYIGTTYDLEKRLKEHNSGEVRSTKFYRPYDLIHKEEFFNKTDVRKGEIELKKNSSKKEALFKLLGLV